VKRPAQPEEIAPAYVFFAAPTMSSYITGEIIPIPGAMLAGSDPALGSACARRLRLRTSLNTFDAPAGVFIGGIRSKQAPGQSFPR
jgi:hypothetical protein